ncbi:NAD(P)H-quinone oxidoreductase [Chitinivorax sp. B]|uniref:NAD(P)H-quinone oxidoreductase n=1 Tax=Chitinivorax sp. B TaxID=2502235 RepID=UPI0020179A58|nr:NAD(P)H-quinone oxidoreductase [Chitinivorax sp. B]
MYPSTMHAFLAPEPGSPEALTLSTLPTPTPKRGEVLIKVAAAGLNRLDIFQRQGRYPPPPGASDILGLEVAGTVVAVGQPSPGIQIGDQVCALLTGGGYAEYCTAPAALCLPIPEGWSMLEAASIPEALFTVWSNIFMRAAIAPSESLFVQGGASGIGTMAIQLARAFGHPVFTTARNQEKCQACLDLGATIAIDYQQQDFVDIIKQVTHGRGVDVILDLVGGSYIPRELSVLADDGRLCLIALLGGTRSEVNLAEMLKRRLTMTASTLRPRQVDFKAHIAQQLKTLVWPLLDHRTIHPVIWAAMPFEQAAAAHRLLEAGEHIGKIMLKLDN